MTPQQILELLAHIADMATEIRMLREEVAGLQNTLMSQSSDEVGPEKP